MNFGGYLLEYNSGAEVRDNAIKNSQRKILYFNISLTIHFTPRTYFFDYGLRNPCTQKFPPHFTFTHQTYLKTCDILLQPLDSV